MTFEFSRLTDDNTAIVLAKADSIAGIVHQLASYDNLTDIGIKYRLSHSDSETKSVTLHLLFEYITITWLVNGREVVQSKAKVIAYHGDEKEHFVLYAQPSPKASPLTAEEMAAPRDFVDYLTSRF